MDPVTLLVVGGAVAGVAALLDAVSKQDRRSPSERSRDEIQRIGDETIKVACQTSKDFREHIDRETRG
jgi:hypothetical protein